MAQRMFQMDREKLSCSICLDLLKEPVTIPCGHSYCMGCIKDCWDEKVTYNCPQCRQRFSTRPALVKNIMFAELVEDMKKVELQACSPDQSYVGPEDVVCDFCSEKKLKAFKSCLVCMASFCEEHLQPHYTIAPLKKHKLVDATLKLQENACPRHDEVMKIFCRTDRQTICYLCSMDDHKGHDTVSAAAERAERQTELGASRRNIQQRVRDREEDVKVLQQRVETINVSADQAVRDSEKMFTAMVRLIERRSSEVKQEIRSKQKGEVGRAEELEERLQKEITELKGKDAELEKLSHTENHLHFLNNYSSLSSLREWKDLPSLDIGPLCSFEDVTAAVSGATDKLQALLSEEGTKISLAVTRVDVLTPAEPRTRDEFQRYSRQITLDPNTANERVALSDRNRKVTLMDKNQVCSAHPDRFVQLWQVLSEEGLSGHCYWEVKWSGVVFIAIAYKDIPRTGSTLECGFGRNDKSWSLECSSSSYTFRHNNIPTSIPGPHSSTIGVYLDHGAGTVSFYSVSDTMTLLHKVQTTFTRPLYPGFWLPNGTVGDFAELCDIK